ncbi:MAG: formate/nitrite transporter family protein [Tissierellales bacterium]|nr:formate/nitrite transporter family protein [Tissierellales bacterium]
MEKSFLTPAEIAESWVEIGKKKANLPLVKMLLLSMMAGMFIGLGGHGAITVMQSLGENVDPGFAKFMGAAVFPVGLMLVVIAGGELFTGNCMITFSTIAGKETYKKVLINWFFVYFGNMAGAVLLAYFLSKSGLYSGGMADKVIAIATAKTSLTFSQVVIRGTFCNILVALAVYMQSGSKDMAGKISAMWFPVMLFVLSGFEHSIANMLFIPLGIFVGADITWTQMWMSNLIPATIGNIIGGAIIVPLVYWYVFINTPIRQLTNKKSMAS